jgi:hypothetical protein
MSRKLTGDCFSRSLDQLHSYVKLRSRVTEHAYRRAFEVTGRNIILQEPRTDEQSETMVSSPLQLSGIGQRVELSDFQNYRPRVNFHVLSPVIEANATVRIPLTLRHPTIRFLQSK